MKWMPLFEQIEAIIEWLENAPASETDKEYLLRIQLANQLAEARKILRALANDEEMKKPENERELIP